MIKKYGAEHQSFDAIGYREVIGYLNGKTSLEEVSELIKKNTRKYAKRQITWFGKDKRIHWFRDEKEMRKLVKDFLF